MANANIQFLHGKNIANNDVIAPGTFYLDTENNELWYDDPSQENEGHIRLFDDLFNDIYSQLADLNYEQIAINEFKITSHNTTQEHGNVITGDITFKWTTTKPPTYLTVTDRSAGTITEDLFKDVENNKVKTGNITVSTGSGISNTKTYRLTAGDNRTRDDENYDLSDAIKDASITFCYPIFYGAVAKGTTFSPDVLRSLTKKLATSRKGNFAVDGGAVADNKIPVYAIPVSYGTPTFTVGGFATTYPVTTISYTSDTTNPYTIDYNIYYDTNIGLGEHTIVVT